MSNNNQHLNQQEEMGNLREIHQTAHNAPNQHSNVQHTSKHSMSNQDWKNVVDRLKVQLNNLNINPVERPEEFYEAISKLIGDNHYFLNFINQLQNQNRFGINSDLEGILEGIDNLINENGCIKNFISQLQTPLNLNLNQGETLGIILKRIFGVIGNLINENKRLADDNKVFNESVKIYETNSKELARYQNEVEPHLNQVIESQSAEHTDLVTNYNDLVTNYKKLHAEKENLTNKLNIIEPEYNDLMLKFNDLVPKYKQLRVDNENLTNKLNIIEPEYNDLMPKFNDLVPKYKQLRVDNENLTNKLNIIEPEYNDLMPKFNDLVPKYKQLRVDNENLTNKLNSYKEQIKNMEQEMGESNSKIAKSEEKGNLYLDELVKNKEKLNKYQQEIDKYIEQINSLNNNLEINQQEITTLKINISRAKANYDKLNNDYTKDKIYQDNKIAELITESQNKALFVKDLEKSKRELEAINEKLRKEASSYQSALGDALNFRLSDEDNNNSVQLSADINSLQDKLERYVTTLKGSIQIDNNKIQELYGKYNLNNQNINDKILMKSVLQRHVLEKILEYIDNYLEIKDDDEPSIPNNQEKYIMNHTNELIFLLDKFYNNHFEQDNNVIKAIPTKIRQQVYGILGEFGFSETYENKIKQYTHPFISSTALELNQFMAGYRYIKDDTKRKNVENMAENLIKDIIQIFKFRLLVQEPKCETRWFEKGIKINPQFMKGQWDDDCLDDYVVDICYFPLIGMELNDLSKKNSNLFKGAIKGLIKYITPATSSSIPSQSSVNSDHISDPNKRQNSANNDHNRDPNKRQNSVGSDRNRNLDKRQNSASSDRNNGPDKHQNSVNNDRNRDSYKHQNSASSDHNSDSNKRQNSDNNDCNRDQKKHQSSASSDPNDNNLSHNHSHCQKNHSQNFNNQSLGGNELQAKPHVQSRPIGNVDSLNLSKTSSKNSTNTKGNNNETSRPHIENSETPSAPSTNDGNEGSETRGSKIEGSKIEGSKIKGGKNQTDSLVLGDDDGKVTCENGNGKKKNLVCGHQSNNDSLDEDDYVDVKKET
ncbi:9798_t:CDS:2 [Entrophospora sp. SA101]|nr:9798_t:CDS:2 [Entrophospora sp. SA101]